MIETVTELADSLSTRSSGLENEIREALTNLTLQCYVDALPAGGILTLRTGVVNDDPPLDGFAEAGYAYVEVVDTGLGMDEDNLPALSGTVFYHERRTRYRIRARHGIRRDAAK